MLTTLHTVCLVENGDELRVGSVMLQFRQPPGHRSTMTLVVDRRV